jgi:hypothetical protein
MSQKTSIPKSFSGLKVLTAGIPLSTPQPQTMMKGIDRVLELSLDGIEVEFVHGVRTKDEELLKFGKYGEGERNSFYCSRTVLYKFECKRKKRSMKRVRST